MDGVLVDVSNSYRQAITQTTEFFTGKNVLPKEIQELKQQTGYNNDWDLTEALIKKRGKIVPKQDIINKFQELYLGTNEKEGLISNEKWLLDKELLEALSKKYLIGLVTGRPKEEALIPLQKEGVEKYFCAIVAMEDCAKKGKPNPFGINLCLEKLGISGGETVCYVGDALDDIRAAKAAGIDAIGCLPPRNRSMELRKLMQNLGAKKVIEEVNELAELV